MGHRNQLGLAMQSRDGRDLVERERTERRRRDQHHPRRAELRMADRQLGRDYAGPWQGEVRARRDSIRRSSTGCRRSRSPAWRSTPAIGFRRGRATCSSARCASARFPTRAICSASCSTTKWRRDAPRDAADRTAPAYSRRAAGPRRPAVSVDRRKPRCPASSRARQLTPCPRPVRLPRGSSRAASNPFPRTCATKRCARSSITSAARSAGSRDEAVDIAMRALCAVLRAADRRGCSGAPSGSIRCTPR